MNGERSTRLSTDLYKMCVCVQSCISLILQLRNLGQFSCSNLVPSKCFEMREIPNSWPGNLKSCLVSAGILVLLIAKVSDFFSIPYVPRNRPKGSPLRIWRLNNECGIKDLDLHMNLHFPVFWITPECLAGFGIFWYHWSLFKIFLTIQRGHGWHRRKNHKWQVTAVLHSHTPTCCIAHYSLLLRKFGEEIAQRIFLK